MAITLVTEPTTGAPIAASDYTAQNGLISANQVPMLSVLSSWESTNAAPTIKQNAFIRHAGNTYQVDTADETISGAPVSGINYIELTLSGSTLVAAWVTSLTGYAYNPVYGGIYNGSGNQLLRDVCYLDGTDYLRGMAQGQDFVNIFAANGAIYMGGDIDMVGNILPTSAGSNSSITLANNATFTLPRGVWYLSGFNTLEIEYSGHVFVSDGTTLFRNTLGITATFYYRRVL